MNKAAGGRVFSFLLLNRKKKNRRKIKGKERSLHLAMVIDAIEINGPAN